VDIAERYMELIIAGEQKLKRSLTLEEIQPIKQLVAEEYRQIKQLTHNKIVLRKNYR